jgi:hypothetical protein
MLYILLSSRFIHVAEAGGIFIALSLIAVFFLARFSRTDDPEDNGEETSERLNVKDYNLIWKKEIEL